MKSQNFKNHSRLIFMYHGVTLLLILALLVISLVHTFTNVEHEMCVGLMFFMCSLILASLFLFARVFALKAQDRAIRAEENFRHYLLTQKQLPSGLSVPQVVALRFASDEEFPALAEKAAKENLPAKEIKLAIKNWRGDYYRV